MLIKGRFCSQNLDGKVNPGAVLCPMKARTFPVRFIKHSYTNNAVQVSRWKVVQCSAVWYSWNHSPQAVQLMSIHCSVVHNIEVECSIVKWCAVQWCFLSSTFSTLLNSNILIIRNITKETSKKKYLDIDHRNRQSKRSIWHLSFWHIDVGMHFLVLMTEIYQNRNKYFLFLYTSNPVGKIMSIILLTV